MSNAWQRVSLIKRYVLVSSPVVLMAMLTIGFWVSREIEHGVTQYSAASSALYMDGIIAPLAQELENRDRISKESAAKIDSIIMNQTRTDSQIVAVKLWKRDGVVAYSTWKDLIGKRFKPTGNFNLALNGVVSAEYGDVEHEDNTAEKALGLPLLEVYAPILSVETGDVLAVAEFYIASGGLEKQLAAAALQSWLVVGCTTVAMALALFGVVYGANVTIERQRLAMQDQIVSLENLVEENRQLSRRLKRSYTQSSTIHEHLLRRLGADLHDGPAQLLGLALMRLDALFPTVGAINPGKEAPTAASEPKALEIVRGALTDAMSEIRNLASGFALPELTSMSLENMVQLVVRNHENRTNTRVALSFRTKICDLSIPAKECIYRFIQEALNNSYRHAEGREQRITVIDDADCLVVQASDAGPGLQMPDTTINNGHFGLSGLRGRVEALGGEFSIASEPGHGATLIARFLTRDISGQELSDA